MNERSKHEKCIGENKDLTLSKSNIYRGSSVNSTEPMAKHRHQPRQFNLLLRNAVYK